ncbi:MAG: heavy-metal-associated domain-containing protein [Acidobacteria bacterium]|nr:heavy-metal-associated domain-containing protein [Acidobacteriota bacterium]
MAVKGMTCAGCARTIERKLRATPGVSNARVDLAAEAATVDFDPSRAQVADLVAAVEKLGYQAPASGPGPSPQAQGNGH